VVGLRLWSEFSLYYGEKWNDWFIFDEKKLTPPGCWAKTLNKEVVHVKAVVEK
jgi:hypothetical protein